MSGGETKYSVKELAELGGVVRRTVRYYVQRGLLPTPTGTGRGKHYTQAHLDTLIRIRELQEAGVSLAEIAQRLAGGASEGPSPRPQPVKRAVSAAPMAQSAWTRVEVADGVELHLRRERALDSRTLERVRAAVQAALAQEDA